MLSLSHYAVVIVDGQNIASTRLADRFRDLGARVYVVASGTAAAMIVRNKRVDVVFIGYTLRDDAELRKTLVRHGVGHITCATQGDIPALTNELEMMESAVAY